MAQRVHVKVSVMEYPDKLENKNPDSETLLMELQFDSYHSTEYDRT